MPLPKPETGLVIHFDYLWRYEREAGQDDGSKRRPCVIVVAVSAGQSGQYEVIVAPVTHAQPEPGAGVEVPAKVKKHLGLDNERSWIITNDLNAFVWPGYDLYEVPNSPPGTYEYGQIPQALFQQVLAEIQAASSMANATRRTG